MTRTLILTGVAAMLGLMGCGWAQPVIDYVNAPDDSFAWEVAQEREMAGGTLTELKVTSQTWQELEWTHRVNVFMPPGCEDTSVALMMITGGSPEGQEMMLLASAAQMLGAPVVVLGDIPNQPLFGGLNEDALISYTFTKYLETGDMDWPLLFPMTKAAVRTMDAVEAFSAEAWGRPIERWITTGASKRGWTTWFTGAVVPERLKGIAPMVYDNLDLPAQMKHQIDAWGDYSPMIHDYTERGLPDLLATREGRALGAIVDPYTLRDRITIPKLTITGTNDPYWPLDAANLYWDGLRQPNYILYVPNGGHGLGDFERVINAQVGFFKACTGRVALPNPTWQFDDVGYLRLTINPGDALPVVRVTEFKAHSPTRDFRGAEWTGRDAVEHRGTYIARALHPDEGYTALLGEIVYEVDGREFPLSTNVRIIGPGE
ncbi:MAG: PhoPQ-activated pathogenicity-related family protein [Armatimonadota bacterium]|jgi:PhoPQ-activated pathogenicity-related protein